jgi:hypothetical protein
MKDPHKQMSTGSQADRLRQLSSAGPISERRERIVLVAGAKGGVGTTAIALAVARELAANVGPTVVASACPGRSDLTLMAGAGFETLDEPFSQPIDERLVLLRLPLTDKQQPNGDKYVSEALGRLPREGWLVIDVGLASSEWCKELSPLVGRLLLVTTTDDVSKLNAYGAIKRLHSAGVTPRWGVLVNHCPDVATAESVSTDLSDSAKKYLDVDAPLAGWLTTTSSDPTTQTIGAAA